MTEFTALMEEYLREEEVRLTKCKVPDVWNKVFEGGENAQS